MMGTPYYHTDESALQTVNNYRDLQGYYTIEEALACMEANIDDLDNEERSAYRHVMRIRNT
jgi:hypothetical protein